MISDFAQNELPGVCVYSGQPFTLSERQAAGFFSGPGRERKRQEHLSIVKAPRENDQAARHFVHRFYSCAQ